MSILNYLFNKSNELNKTNSLDFSGNSREFVNNFLKFASDQTRKRSAEFSALMDFVLESKQWTSSELNIKDSENEKCLTFNFTEEYVSRYIARLFPRNPHTGVLEIGVKVKETNKALNRKFEDEILEIYQTNHIPDILNEQSLNFFVGGAGCLYYPVDPITKRANIFSLDPTKCYLGWSGGRLVQFAFRDYVGSGKYKYTYYDLHSVIVYDEAIEKTVTVENKDKIIPFSWIPNFPNPHSHEGKSKILQLAE